MVAPNLAIKIIEAPRLFDLVTSQGSTPGLVSLVNAFLATIVNPVIRAWSLDTKLIEKRMNIQWMFTVVYDVTGAPLATPFSLQVSQATHAADLETALNSFYGGYGNFASGVRVTKLDSDVQNQAKQFVAAQLLNATPGASVNYSLTA